VVQKNFEKRRNNPGHRRKAKRQLDAPFAGAYSIEAAMCRKDKDGANHAVGCIEAFENKNRFRPAHRQIARGFRPLCCATPTTPLKAAMPKYIYLPQHPCSASSQRPGFGHIFFKNHACYGKKAVFML